MFADWQLKPGPCPTCGSGQWIRWFLRVGEIETIEQDTRSVRADGVEYWRRPGHSGTWCRACQPHVELTAIAVAVAVSLQGQVFLWQRSDVDLDKHAAGAVKDWLFNASRIQGARAEERRKPGKWKLELRDGRIWMPWNPWQPSYQGKAGEPWPLRPGVLHRSRNRSRSCMVCHSKLDEGSSVYRPDTTYKPRGWPKAETLVCLRCAAAVLAESAEPDAPGRRVVGHLVVVDGGG